MGRREDKCHATSDICTYEREAARPGSKGGDENTHRSKKRERWGTPRVELSVSVHHEGSLTAQLAAIQRGKLGAPGPMMGVAASGSFGIVVVPVGKRKKPRPRLPQKPSQTPKKERVWTLPVVIGLTLSLVGLWVFWPTMTVSPEDPLEQANPFTVPFKITNTGLMSFYAKHVVYFINDIKIGPLSFEGSGVGNTESGQSSLGEKRVGDNHV